MKDIVIDFLTSHGFETISHETSSRMVFFKDNVTVTVKERK
jgi:hypothetical protein